MNYYNENNPEAAAWLRELIKQNQIAPGVVDECSITDVNPDELKEFCQCHFFAGIGGWSYALRLAGWPDDEPIWTGSCPCQPFSAAGKKQVDSDERHLWPAFRTLIAQRKPAIVFGEQVASKDGRIWLTGVRTDMEALGYAVGAADICAAGLGAPHIRQRLFWVADAEHNGGRTGQPRRETQGRIADGGAGRMGHSHGAGLAKQCGTESIRAKQPAPKLPGDPRARLGDAQSWNGRSDSGESAGRLLIENGGGNGGVEHSKSNGRIKRRPESDGRSIAGGCGIGGMALTDCERGPAGISESQSRQIGKTKISFDRRSRIGFWDRFDTIACADGKTRRIEPGSFPLAHGVSGRVGLLRGYGNAIVPQLAAQFIQAAGEAIGDMT